jgi:hypothetical protein
MVRGNEEILCSRRALPRFAMTYVSAGAGFETNATLDYGCSLHHSGQRTLRGVRVAFTTVR